MVRAGKRFFLIMLLLLVVPALKSPACHANSAEPPSILIIVPNPPDDLQIDLVSGSEYITAQRLDKNIEHYYTFYSRDLSTAGDYKLKITTGDRSFEIELGELIKTYNNIFTLDLKKQILTPGKSLSRSISLVALRLILTLFIEALIFWLFRYREKKSWIAFIVINLITQGGLNIWINGFTPLAGYLIIALIFGEMLVFLVEVAAFSSLVKEHSRLKTFFYVLIANLASLIFGGYIITVLPI